LILKEYYNLRLDLSIGDFKSLGKSN